MAAKKKAARKKKAEAPQITTPKGPRQKPLPGMEDRAIEVLNDAALHYDEIKKARMKLTTEEVEAKRRISTLMHARKKTHYQYGNILIDLTPEGEKVTVKVLDAGSDEPAEDVEVSITEQEPEETEIEEVPDFEGEEEELAEVEG